MSIITISRGSYSKGKEIAEKLAHRLGYECVSRDILLEASESFNIPEIKLVRAIHDAPSMLDRITRGKENKVAYTEVALLRHLQRDNVVYHGLAGHFFVKDIPHVLKVRITASMEDRVRLEMQRENISSSEALHILQNDDEQRRKWSLFLYGVDTRDPSLYDLVIHIHKLTVDDAVDIIRRTVGMDSFRTTPASQQAMDDRLLAAEVKLALVGIKASVDIAADGGIVYLTSKSGKSESTAPYREMEKIVRAVPGVKDVRLTMPLQTHYTNPWHNISNQ